MKKITGSLFILLIIFTSCDISEKLNKTADPEANNNLSETNFQISNNTKSKKDYYYEYELNYPILNLKTTDNGKQAINVFNTEIDNFINSYLIEYDAPSLSEKKSIVDVIIKEDSIEAKNNHMFYSLFIKPLINENAEKSIISIKFIIDKFDLGAHGNTYFKTFNFDINKGKFVSMEEILDLSTDQNIYKLDELIAKNFEDPLNCFDIGPKSTLKDVQFSLTDENAVFSYQPYILGSYACGSCTILIPISTLKEANLWK